MYKIEFADIENKVRDYIITDDFMNKVGEYMKSFLTAKVWDYKYYGNKSIKLTVKEDSVTYRFLQKYSERENLYKLLAGKLNDQMDIIKDVYEGIPDNTHPAITFTDAFIRINKRIKKYQKNDKTYDSEAHDDFNSIMRHIFEVGIYGKESPYVHMDKEAFVKRLGLRVCPYCGRSYIYGFSTERNSKKVAIKPQIDHLFPKSIYPFLAVNFFNLIPCCQSCNMIAEKGDQDVLTKRPDGRLRINHPYLFDNSSITFGYNIKSEKIFNADDIEINVDYHGDEILKDGYNKLFFIDEYYKLHNLEAHDLYIKLKSLIYTGTKKSYEAMGLPHNIWEQLPLILFGYNFSNEEAAKHPLCKFNHDIYKKMYDDFKRGCL